jgi:crotonobetainyl-CoA:carnitine CoA-transferase CaiB-like acyl-CoA transferase
LLAVQLPLDGIRVIDLTSVVMGPVATQILADQGADVIVVEDRRGDTNRSMGVGAHRELSGVAINLLRNKRSVGLDIKSEAGYAALGRLVATADVVVTNLRPGSRARAGLTFEALSGFRPGLIFCAAAGYPVDHELADAPAYDDIIQAASGVVDLNLQIGLPPVLMPTLVADKGAGLVIANAVLAALVRRERTGEGSDLTIAMIEVMRAYLLVEHGANAIAEPPLGPAGYPRILNPDRRPHPTADGMISVLPYDEHHYETIFRLGGREDLLDDPRVATRRSRIENGPSLYQEVAAILQQRTTAEWLDLLRTAGIPVAEVATIDDMVAALPLADHPHAGRYRVTPPLTGSVADVDVVRRHAPLQGEHNREVLAEVGYSDDDLDVLERDGVLFRAPG